MDIEKKKNLKEVIEWIICIIIAIALALLVRHYIFTPTVVKQVSMKPTLISGDRLILNRWCITTREEIKRGEIITFEAPSSTDPSKIIFDPSNPVAEYSNEPDNIFSSFVYYVLEFTKESYIKRVIAVEGDHILIENGKVYLNGALLKEDYLQDGLQTDRTGKFYDLTVPKGYVFAMGDNRGQSRDCRAFGCVPISKIESKVAFRFWPLEKWGDV